MALSRKRFPDNISIAKKTAILIAVTTCGVLFIGGFSHLGLYQIKNDALQHYGRTTEELISLDHLQKRTTETLMIAKTHDISLPKLKQTASSLHAEWQGVMAHHAKKRESYPPSIQKIYADLIRTYRSLHKELELTLHSATPALSDATIKDLSMLQSTTARIIDLYKELYRHDKQKIEEHYREIIETLAFLTFSLLLFALFFTREIVKNIKALVHGLSDIVERKTREYQELNHKLEEKIRRVVEKNREKDQIMYQHARLAAMGEMIGNIAHQWRQPLNALTVLIQSFGIKSQNGKLEQEFIDKQVKEGLRLAMQMSNTIEDFRNFFNPRKEREYFNLSETLEETMELVEYFCKDEHIQIEIDCKEEMRLFGYSNEFSQVILNLINNARDNFKQRNMNEERKIIIRAEKKVKPDHTYAFITFTDNGGGIDPNIKDRIFEPYFTTKHKSTGTGIGLYMSKQIIEKQMQGLITARNTRSRLGTQTTYSCAQFIIAIPLK